MIHERWYCCYKWYKQKMKFYNIFTVAFYSNLSISLSTFHMFIPHIVLNHIVTGMYTVNNIANFKYIHIYKHTCIYTYMQISWIVDIKWQEGHYHLMALLLIGPDTIGNSALPPYDSISIWYHLFEFHHSLMTSKA